MRWARFSLAWLMGIVLFCALAAGGLHGSNEIWASTLFSLTLGLLLVGLVVGLVRTGRARAGGLGFALVGLGYLAASLGPWDARHVGAPPLLTSLWLQRAFPHIHPTPLVAPFQGWVASQPANPGWVPQPASSVSTIAYFRTAAAASLAPPPTSANPSDFYRVGHSLIALLAAFLGAVLSRRIFDRDAAGRDVGSSSAPQPSTEN